MWQIEAAKIEAKRFLSYRVDFWLLFVVHTFTDITVAYYLWRALFDISSESAIGGFTFPQMLSYYIFVPFVDRMVRSNDDFSTSSEIYAGGLNKYLLYPISFLTYKIIQKYTYSLLALGQMLLAFVIIVPLFDIQVTPIHFFIGVLACMASFLLYTFMGLIFELIAFWADAVWSLGVMLRFITMFFGGSMIPIALFPEWGQAILKFTPFPYLFSVPIETFLGRLSYVQSFEGIAITLIWCIPFSIIAISVYRYGLKTYTGIGI